jgi:hypothetical protein
MRSTLVTDQTTHAFVVLFPGQVRPKVPGPGTITIGNLSRTEERLVMVLSQDRQESIDRENSEER